VKKKKDRKRVAMTGTFKEKARDEMPRWGMCGMNI
jgi:hypothetical protein